MSETKDILDKVFKCNCRSSCATIVEKALDKAYKKGYAQAQSDMFEKQVGYSDEDLAIETFVNEGGKNVQE